MPHKVSLYLDMSVPNALFIMPEDRKEATSLFFQETAPKHEVFISELVVGEIEATPDDAHGIGKTGDRVVVHTAGGCLRISFAVDGKAFMEYGCAGV
jgi:hypothetical protein